MSNPGDGIGKDLYRLLPTIFRQYDHTERNVPTNPNVPDGVLPEIEVPLWTAVREAYQLVYPRQDQKFTLRFLRIFGDTLDVLWGFMDKMRTLQDADQVANAYLNHLASNLGMDLDNSFDVATRRLFIKNIIWIYKHKGTNEGIIGAIKRLTGHESIIEEWNNHYYYWRLHTDSLPGDGSVPVPVLGPATLMDPPSIEDETINELGVDTILGFGGYRWWLMNACSLGIDTILGNGYSHYMDDVEWAASYTFTTYVFAHCTPELLRLLESIVAYMKPDHTHHWIPWDINGKLKAWNDEKHWVYDGFGDPVGWDTNKLLIKCVYDLSAYSAYSDWTLYDDLLSYLGVSTILGTG